MTNMKNMVRRSGSWYRLENDPLDQFTENETLSRCLEKAGYSPWLFTGTDEVGTYTAQTGSVPGLTVYGKDSDDTSHPEYVVWVDGPETCRLMYAQTHADLEHVLSVWSGIVNNLAVTALITDLATWGRDRDSGTSSAAPGTANMLDMAFEALRRHTGQR